ncbi:hypothetical protein [Azospirillum brasilense]|uniref:hypothetical protein n=1 Tax=Azospirillum brasilense TaxID=192 RepID=UPI001FFFAC47|nr:hypothetical protein [Azospirillum brasilense]
METRTAPGAAAARWRLALAVRFTTPEGRTEEAAGMVMEGTPLAVARRAGLKRNGVPLDPWMVTAGGRVVGRQKTRQAARLFAERAAPLADWTSLPDSPPDRLWLARDGQPLDRLLARLSVAVAAGDLAAFDADQQELREALELAAALPPVDEDAPWARLVEISGPRWLLVGRDVERLDRALGLPDGGGRGVWLAGRHGDLAFLGGDRVPALVMDRFGAAAAYAALRNSGAAVRRLRWSHGDLTPVFPAERRAVINVAGNRLTAVLDAEHRTVTLRADPDRPSPLCDPLAPDCRRDDWTVGGLAVPDRPETGRDAAQAALSAPLRFPITVTIGGRPQELIARIASSDPPPAARLCSPLDELRLERPDGRPFERGTEFRRLSSGIRYHPDPLARLAEVARARAQDVLDERWRRSQRVLKRIDKAAGSRSAFARALSRALGARTVLELRNEAVSLAGFWGGETSSGADLAKAAGRMQKRIDAAGIADTRLEEARGAAARAVARRPPLAERPEIRALFHPEMPAYPDPDRVNRAVEALRPVIAKRRPERRQDVGTDDPQYSLGWRSARISGPSVAFSLGAVPRIPPELVSYRRQPEPPIPDRIPVPGEIVFVEGAGQKWLYRAVTPGAAIGSWVNPDAAYQAQQNLLATALRPLASSCLPTDLAEGRVHVAGAIVAKVGGAGGPIEPLSGLTAPLRSGDGSVHHHAFVAMTDANPANALFHESVHVNLREGRLSADEFLPFCDPESCRLGAERFGFAGYPVRRFAEELAAHAHAEAAAGPAGRTPVAWRSAGDDVRGVRGAALRDHLVADLALPDRTSAVLQALADGTFGARPAVPEVRDLWLREMGRRGGAADPAILSADEVIGPPPALRQYSVAGGRDAPLSPADRDALQALSRHLSGAGMSWGFALPGADPRGRRIFTDKTYSAAVGEVRLRPTPDGAYAAEALPWTAPAGRLEQGKPGKRPAHPAMEKAVAAAASFAGGTAMPPVRVLDEGDALGDVPPWRLSRAEYVARRMPELADLDLQAIDPRLVKPLARRHAAAVFDAVARGEPVPDRVLAGHPVLVQMDAAARAVAPDDRARPVNEPEPGEDWTARPAVLAVSGPDGWEKVTLTVETRGPFAVHRPVDLRIVGWSLASGPDLDAAALRNAAAAARGRSDAVDGAMRRYEATALAEALDRIAADMDGGTAYRSAAAREIARARGAMPRADLAAALGGRAAPLTETRTSGRGWVVSHLPTGLPLVTAAHAVPTKNECRRVVDAIGTGWPWAEVTFGRLPDLLRSPAYRAAADRWGEAGAAIHAVGQARKAVRQARAAVIKAQTILVQVQDKETAAIEKRNGILGYAPSADIPAAGLRQYAMRSDAMDAQSGPVRAIRQEQACGKLLSVRDRDTGAGLALETHRMSTLTAATVAEPSPLPEPLSGKSFPLSDPALRAAYADAAQTAADGDEGALTVARFAQGDDVALFAAGVAADELRALARIANLPLADHGPEGVAVPVSALPVLRGFSAVPIVEADLTATAESRNWSRAALAGAGAAVGVAAAAGAVHLAGRDDVPAPLAAAEAVDEPIRNARELAEATLADAGQIAERLTRNAADVGASLAETRRMIEEALAGTAPSAAVGLPAVTAESPKVDPSDLSKTSEAEAAIRDGGVGALLTPADPAEPQAVTDILARIDAARAGMAASVPDVPVPAEADAKATETIRATLEADGGKTWYEGALDAARAVADGIGGLQFSTGAGKSSASIPAPAAIQPFYARNDEQGLAEARVRAQGIPSDDLANRAAVTAALLVRREADPAANPATLEALRAGKAVLKEEVRRREAGLQAIQPFFVAEGEAGRNEAVLRASRIPAPDLVNRLAMTKAMLAAKLPEAGGSAGVRGSLERGVAVLEGETSRRAALDRPQDITRKPTRRGGMER